ncbi:MAG: ribonuclease HII, partial [Acidimicrobiia bacterium]|nr:ribonuclease HII [Acidimicrobiia bacterium]
MTTPTLRLERRCWKAGERVVVGIDEVGRGAWAGPVTVAAVVPAPEHLRGVRDSKQISRQARPGVAADVREWAVAIGVGHASHEECDALGMTAALRSAAFRHFRHPKASCASSLTPMLPARWMISMPSRWRCSLPNDFTL